MANFTVFRDRDAWATIRGYFYQIQITIQRWLDLEPGEELRLECGEDIDRVGRALSESGTGSEASRLLEQVKHREKPVTLRSAEALAALVSFHRHRVANPQVRLRFRYITNAPVGREAKSHMPGGVPAIEAWERLRSESFGPGEEAGVLAGIRSLLSIVPKPRSVLEEDWRALCQFIRAADDAELLGLVRSVEWGTGTTSFELMESEIEQQLVETGRAASPEESHSLYQRLVLFVLKRLSASGPKSLAPEDLDGVISAPGLGAADSRLLQMVDLLLVSATESLQDIRDIKGVTADVRETVRGIASRLGLGDLKAVAAQPVPVDVPPPVQCLANRETNVSQLAHLLETAPYCAIHGDVGSGKTQLTVLVSRRLGRRAIWVRLRQLTPEQASQVLDAAIASTSRVRPSPLFTAWYSKACRALGPQALIVLDDLPRVLANDHLSTRLAILAEICAERGLRIVSTSAYELPIAAQEQMGTLVVPAKVPPFSDDEIEELFLAHGMPCGLNIRKFIPMLEAVTRRHPVLLAAAARHMASAGWALNWGVLEGLLKGVFAEELKPDTQQMLLATMPDPLTRNLLYRLTLASPFFTKEQAVVIAAVQPTLDRPVERLNDAVGLWIQEENASTYSLSPLLGNIDLDLSVTTQRTIHLALADGIMKRRFLGPVEVLKAFSHFALAGAVQRAAVLLLMALMDFNDLEEMPDDWGLLGLWAHAQLPTEVDLAVRLLLRTHQCVAFLRRGKDAEYLLNDFDNLLSQAGQAQAFATTSGCALLALRLKDDQPSRANRYLSRALASGPSLTLPDGTTVTIPGDARLEHLLWATASAARTEADVQSWLSVLEGLSPDQLSRVFESEHAENGCVIFCDGVWLREAAKPAEEQQWAAVLGQLKMIEEAAARLGGLTLKACAVRAQIGLLAECVKDVDRALNLATQTLQSLGDGPIQRFLVMEIAGRECVYTERWRDAAEWLNQAVVLGGDAYPILRVDALIALSEAISHTVGAAAAVSPCEQAVQIARSTPDVPEIALVQALGENAIACWYAGDRGSAYRRVQECVERLLNSRSDKTIWKKAFMLAGHLCGYLSTVARFGKLPEGMTEYEPPRRGVFNTSNPDVAKLYDPNREWAIAGQVAIFAAALGNDEGAATWALRAVELGRTAQGGEISGLLKLYALTQAILDQRYLDALELAVEATAAVVSLATKPKDQQPASWASPPKTLSELSKSDAETVSVEHALLMGFVPIVFGLARAWLSDSGSAAETADSVASRCRSMAQGTSSLEAWNRAADIVMRVFGKDASADELKELGEQFASISSSLHVACYLGAMLRVRPEHALKIQLAVLPFLERALEGHGVYRGIIVPFLRRFWENKVQQSPFYFREPSSTLELIKATGPLPAPLCVRQLLRGVALSLGLTLGAEERNWLADRSSAAPSL
jgi:hypothetical protein